MNYSHSDFVTTNQLIADILVFCDDEDYMSGKSEGWYISQIQQALEELSFDTFFDEQTIDLAIPKELVLDLPAGLFNIREVYIFDSSCCQPSTSKRVYWKRQFNNLPNGTGYTASRKDDTSGHSTDPYYGNGNSFITEREDKTLGFPGEQVFYYNIQNGVMMLSSNVKSYSKIRIVYNGTSGLIGDEPLAPRFFRQAIIDFVTERFFRYKKVKDPAFSSRWREAFQMLKNSSDGSWINAERRIKSMDSKEKEDLFEYLKRPNY